MVLVGRNAIYVVEHDVKNFFRYKWWLVGMISMNIADIAILALVFNGLIARFKYLDFVLPGIVVGSLFASAFTIGREVNIEIRKGLHHYYLSLPLTRVDMLVGRMTAGGIRGLIYIAPLLAFNTIYNILLGPSGPTPITMLYSIAVLTILSIGISALGIALGALTRNFELHVAIRGTTYFLMLFCSTVFYPMKVLELLPDPIPTIAKLNPVSHGADLLRTTLTGHIPPPAPAISITAYSTILIIAGAALYLNRITRT